MSLKLKKTAKFTKHTYSKNFVIEGYCSISSAFKGVLKAYYPKKWEWIQTRYSQNFENDFINGIQIEFYYN